MVLRKQPPPHLDRTDLNLSGRSATSPETPTSPTNPAQSSSPKRLTRARRARSSPHSAGFPLQEAVFSPDLNTSPAFDLMTLEEAKRSPVTSSTADNQNPWADELVERPGSDPLEYLQTERIPDNQTRPQEETRMDNKGTHRVPSILVAGTQRRMAANSEWAAAQTTNDAQVWEQTDPPPQQLRSNNPFLKARQTDANPWGPSPGHSSSATKEQSSNRSSMDEGYIPMTARLSLLDEPTPESPWADEAHSARPAPSERGGNQPSLGLANREHPKSAYQQTPVNFYQTDEQGPEWDLDPQRPADTAKLPLIGNEEDLSSWNIVNADIATTTNDAHALPQASLDSGTSGQPTGSGRTLLPGPSGKAPPLPERRSATEGDAAFPSRSTTSEVPISESETRRQQEQNSETYAIRHINWKDGTGTLRESPVLVQSKNGPCPLLALVNTLVLRVPHGDQPPIVKALRSREQISLGLLIQALFDELTSRLEPEDEVPDIEELSQFLTMLHNGMNVNPRLTLESADALGSFRSTTHDLRLYGTFGVPLVHGWIAAPTSEAHGALMRVAQYHEDIQLLQFRKQELEDRVVSGGSISSNEEQLMRDIQKIEEFVNVENATQLSDFGLSELTAKLPPGSMSILFRNDHFSTVYRDPQTPRLFTLVTDAGYANHAEVVWESLVDTNGYHSEYFSGDFQPVGYGPPASTEPPRPRTADSREGNTATSGEHHTSMSAQEQSDADYAYALSLQFQEEERQSGADRSPDRIRPESSRVGYHRVSDQGQGDATTQSGRPGDRTEGAAGEVEPPPYESSNARPSPSGAAQRGPAASGQSRGPRYERAQHGRRPPGMPATATVGTPQDAKAKNKDCVMM